MALSSDRHFVWSRSHGGMGNPLFMPLPLDGGNTTPRPLSTMISLHVKQYLNGTLAEAYPRSIPDRNTEEKVATA